MAVDVRLTNRQTIGVLDVLAKVHTTGRSLYGLDGTDLRVLRNAALRLGAAMALDLPDNEHTSRARGICLRELVTALREIDGEHG